MMTIKSVTALQTEETLEADYTFPSVTVRSGSCGLEAHVVEQKLRFKTLCKVPPKVGVLLVGIGGNNGSTFVGGILANRHRYQWRSKEGIREANWYGSFVMAGTTQLGYTEEGNKPVFVPIRSLLPMVDPEKLIVGGWDINKANIGLAMKRAAVFDVLLQDQLFDEMSQIKPFPAYYDPDFIAANQEVRADNVITGSKAEVLKQLRRDIKNFKSDHSLEKVIVLWTANTERFCDVTVGVHDTWSNLKNAIEKNHSEVSPSTLYAVAALCEGCPFINGSPQNTCVPGVMELAGESGLFIGGDDFKTGQTKVKSVMCDFLVSAGIKPRALVSYNHLGNNDGLNLNSPLQFRSKEISKRSVIDDVIESNQILYKKNELPEHAVVIKYIPFVGDSKRALDEYSSEIFMSGRHTLTMHNVCEDSLLAAPLMVDLIVLCELFTRISVADQSNPTLYHQMLPVLSLLSLFCKAPLVPHGATVVNAYFAQRAAIVNFLRACNGLPPDDYLDLNHRFPLQTPSCSSQRSTQPPSDNGI